jgi:hypothetical protein
MIIMAGLALFFYKDVGALAQRGSLLFTSFPRECALHKNRQAHAQTGFGPLSWRRPPVHEPPIEKPSQKRGELNFAGWRFRGPSSLCLMQSFLKAVATDSPGKPIMSELHG